MNTIVVPTDFSENAQNAFTYAKQLAQMIGAQLKVVHICHPTTDNINGVSIPTMDELLKARKMQLDRFVTKGASEAIEDLVMTEMIDQELLIGFATEELIRLSAEPQHELIVMGTKGNGNLLEQWVGSVSSSVSQKAHCPVLLVPPNTPFDTFRNILYASNYESADTLMMNRIQQFANLFDANIHLAHVHLEGSQSDQVSEDLLLERLIKQKAPAIEASIASVEDQTVWEGLFHHAQDKQADLIVLVTKHRSFWENLIHKSTTKQMVLNACMPLLILHTDD